MRLKEYLNNNKFFECYILNISENDIYYNDLLEVFCGIIINPLIINDSNHTIILSNEINLDISQRYVLCFGEDECCKANLEFMIGYLKHKGYSQPLKIQILDEYNLDIKNEYYLM